MIPTILCGGAGSRLWPVSRELHPKPFIKLYDGQSLLQKSFIRALALPDVQEVLTVTNQELFFKTQDEYKTVNTSQVMTSYLLEPLARNTAAAIAAAACYVLKTYGESETMLVLAADHLIQDLHAFKQAVHQSTQLAQQGRLVTFGVTPTSPETGYGYIEAQKNTSLGELGYPISRFVEKPDLETAVSYLETGDYYWNAGMFCFTAGTVLKHMRSYCPDILEAVEQVFEVSPIEHTQAWVQCRLDAKAFEEVRSESFDYAVMELASKEDVAVVPCDMGWSDIGSWLALGQLAEADLDGNRIEGHALMHGSKDCFVHSPSRMVGAVGVEHLIIIDTPDALLVANKNCSQDVKHVYTALKKNGHETHRLHKTVHRPWGTYTVLEDAAPYKIKRIEVNPGASLSLQMHHHRNEHWVVVSGVAKVVHDERTYLLGTNESTYIAAGEKHRLENPGMVNLVMIEVQCGDYLGEDDIVRFEDSYGRVSSLESA
jgi:mannose-1-phosphate guanylyltransferase/mannose-6-phosphate isomerase